jgi:hypothetical protein
VKFSELKDLKYKAIRNQFYEIASYARDLERKMIIEIKIEDKIPNEDLKNFNKLIINSYGYYIFKSWMRKVKIKQIYDSKGCISRI